MVRNIVHASDVVLKTISLGTIGPSFMGSFSHLWVRHLWIVVYLWVRDDSIELDNELYRTVCKWLSKEWSFSKIAFPGRCILWKDWDTELSVVQQVN